MRESSIEPALITKIVPDSIAAEMGFEPGDSIVAVNGQKPRDLIDYQFLCADEFLELEVLDAKGKTHKLEIEKEYDEDLGVEFETALFDGLIQTNSLRESAKLCISKMMTTASAFFMVAILLSQI
jgi:NifB/MoaA-like Fe-S oxidoreductase